MRERRHALGVRPVYKRVDTCAAEFATRTAYMYSTYEEECEAQPTDRRKIIVLGGGPNRIGQGIEFDYCCVHAALALREDGFETIMVNCNPETVSTDYDTSDRLYFEPLTLEDVLEIVHVEKPYGVIVQFGGQTPLKLARDLEANGVPIIGTTPDSIDIAEDRERFQKLLNRLKLKQPPNRTARSAAKALARAEEIGYPLVVRPSYVLGGRAMEIVHEQVGPRALHARGDQGFQRLAGAARPLPERRDRSRRRRGLRRQGSRDRRRDGAYRAGRRAFGRFRVLAAAVLARRRSCRTSCAARRSRWRARSRSCGLMNVQFAIQNGVVYVLEVNPRASRTVPFVSKATSLPLAKIAARCMAGMSLRAQNVAHEVVPPYYSVKEAVFPFIKFPGADTILGPEMKSTGEVMGVGETFAEAFVKSQMATGERLPSSGKVFLSVRDSDKPPVVEIARSLIGARIYARRHARHGRGDRCGRAAGHARQQGRRRPAAHRGHDQERRDRDDREYRRRQARGGARFLCRFAARRCSSASRFSRRSPARAPAAWAWSRCRSLRAYTSGLHGPAPTDLPFT